MSNQVIKSYGVYGEERERFLFSLRKSFAMLAGVEDGEVPAGLAGGSGKEWRLWKDFFCSHECSAVWMAWYSEYGIVFLSSIEKWASLLEAFDVAAFKQAVYTLEEANQSGDKEYILDMAADAIEWLYDRAEKLKQDCLSFVTESYPRQDVESSKKNIKLTSSQRTGSFYLLGRLSL